MLFKREVLEKIASGDVTLAFRRWDRPTVRAEGTLRTPVGILAIEGVNAISEEELTAEDVARAGYGSRDALRADLERRKAGKLYRISFHRIGDDPRASLREREALGEQELAELESALAKFDRTSRQGHWTVACLRLIGARDGRTAGELADAVGIDKSVLKRRVRLLKELGLTESLQRGYRLSRRGRGFLKSRHSQKPLS